MRLLNRRTLWAALVGCLVLSGCGAASFSDEDGTTATGVLGADGWYTVGDNVALSLYPGPFFDFDTSTRHWTKFSEAEMVHTESGMITVPFFRRGCQGIGARGRITCTYDAIVPASTSPARVMDHKNSVGYEYDEEFLQPLVSAGLDWDRVIEETKDEQSVRWDTKIVPKDHLEQAWWFGHVINVTIEHMQRRVWTCQQPIGEAETCSEQPRFTFYRTKSTYLGLTNFPETDHPRLLALAMTEGSTHQMMFFQNSRNGEPGEGGYGSSSTQPYRQDTGAVNLHFFLMVRGLLVERTDLKPLWMNSLPTLIDGQSIGITVRPMLKR